MDPMGFVEHAHRIPYLLRVRVTDPIRIIIPLAEVRVEGDDVVVIRRRVQRAYQFARLDLQRPRRIGIGRQTTERFADATDSSAATTHLDHAHVLEWQ
jgi:hypothetical protein